MMDIEEAYTKFPQAKKMTVYIDTVSYAGSGFGINAEGERVFLNSRLVTTVGLEPGNVISCLSLPNYPDKQHEVPWRAIRTLGVSEVVMEEDPETAYDPEDFSEENEDTESPVLTLQDKILQHLRDIGPTSTRTLANALNDTSVGAVETSNACRKLHQTGTVARADVYRKGVQTKASMVVWALSVTEMEVIQDAAIY
jgi:hypothetical protein